MCEGHTHSMTLESHHKQTNTDIRYMKLRARISIDIPDGQIDPSTTPASLKATHGAAIARAVAGALPEGITVNTVIVTKLNIATENAPENAE